MSRTFHHGDRKIRVRAIRNNPPDLRRLARALIELAQAQAETEAATELQRIQELRSSKSKSPSNRRKDPPHESVEEVA